MDAVKTPGLTFACASILVLVLGCGADDGSDEGASADGSSGSGDGSTSGSTTGSGTSATGTSSSTSAAESSGSGGADGSTSDAGSSGGAETSPSGCAMYEDQLECTMAGCVAVVGSEFLMMMDMWCLGPRILIECQEDEGQNCAQTITIACDPNGAEYSFPTTCIPDGWMECDPPVPMAPACG
jgi:hypothetical protein